VKLLLTFFLILGIVVLALVLVFGFVYGIVKRGRERDKAHSALRKINQQCNLWHEDQSPGLTGIRQTLDTFYNGRETE